MWHEDASLTRARSSKHLENRAGIRVLVQACLAWTSRQVYGFRNFQNYRMRVKALCGESV